jgi:hypothetical protein
MRLALATASAQDGSAPVDVETRGARRAKRSVVVFWVVTLVLLLRHREVISSDTLSNYVHVWYVADNVWHGHGLPFHMPVLAHGKALAFPYGFIPWMFAVLLWPVMGEWSVTLALGVGFLGLVAATFWAFPELRRGWWAVAVLVNPAFVEGLLLGQLPFLWAATMLLLAIGFWRKDRRAAAIILAALAQLTHAPVLIPLVGLLVLWWVRFEPERRTLLKGWIVSVVVSLPAAAIVFASPVTAQTSPLWSLWVEVETVALRSLVLVVPIGLLYLQRREWRPNAPVIVTAVMVAGQLITIPISGMGVGWNALVRSPDRIGVEIPQSAAFVRGATYRVLTFGDGKYSQYAVVRAGGRLDSEFFPEDMHRKSFRDRSTYVAFLTHRQVDFVVVDDRYYKFRTNEERLLGDLTALSAGTGCPNGVRVEKVDQEPKFSMYRVIRGCASSSQS